ncbi:MAG TPA: 4-phosphoerythronate dehydrogenase, partial [Gammaproteobacteria bacterium]|nr:4-phosphoerythronate dehydrogenase [Gammaproteobacteria bacterium]
MKIIADPLIPHVREAFAVLGEVSFCDGRSIMSETVRDADMLLVRSVTPVNADLLRGSRVHFVASATSGIDHVDTDYLDGAGIGFAHAPGCNAQSVVEYVLSSMLVLARKYDFRLQEKTAGIIGCGQVGSRLLRALEILDVRCLVNDPPLQERTGDSGFVAIEELLSADLISLHVPLTESGAWPTRDLVNRGFLQQLTPGSILVNTSRGDVVDEKALSELVDRRQHGVVLDVWRGEPAIDRGLLASVDIGTPHIAGYSLDGKIRATTMIRQAACEYFSIDTEMTTDEPAVLPGGRTMRLSGDVGLHDGLELAILWHYDVRSDSAALRRVLEVDPAETADWFD